MSAESTKTGSGCTTKLPSILIRKPDRAKRACALGFNQSRNDRQHFRQRRSVKHQLENVEQRFAGKEAGFVLRRFDSRSDWFDRSHCSLHSPSLAFHKAADLLRRELVITSNACRRQTLWAQGRTNPPVITAILRCSLSSLRLQAHNSVNFGSTLAIFIGIYGRLKLPLKRADIQVKSAVPLERIAMSVAGISSRSFFDFGSQSVQNKMHEFQQLGEDLQSGNLSAAQSDFTTLQQYAPQSSSTSSSQSANPIAQEFAGSGRTFSQATLRRPNRISRRLSRTSRVSPHNIITTTAAAMGLAN
jgi:hypothetical protein